MVTGAGVVTIPSLEDPMGGMAWVLTGAAGCESPISGEEGCSQVPAGSVSSPLHG